METITSTKNACIRRLKELGSKKGREAAGMILVEGEVMIREALKCGLTMGDMIADEMRAELATELETYAKTAAIVPRTILEAVCETRTPQGICASFTMPKPIAEEELPDLVVALDGVQDPGNAGTIWRTADAAGFQAILYGAGSADALSPKVLRAAMGSGFRLPYSKADDLAATLSSLRERGYTVIVSALDGADFYHRSDPGKKIALVIGNEARGASEAVKAQANMKLKLPMRGGAESLNAAIAAAILMYDLINAPKRG